MQSADPNTGAARSARGPLSPAVAFLLLLGVIAVVGTILLLTRPEAPPASDPNPTTHQEPTFTLTNEEAITRFEELNELRFALYEQRDLSLVSSVLTLDSPLRGRASKEIRQLLADDVTVEMNFDTLSLRVLRNSPDQIVLRQVVREEPKFLSRTDKEVTESRAQIRVVRWIVHLEESNWKIYDAITVRSRRVSS